MINNVVLVGRMTRDAELRYTPNNVATASFSLAVTRNFKDANGERDTDFINCVIWRQQAENLANWAKKGALIGITGRIQTRNYENANNGNGNGNGNFGNGGGSFNNQQQATPDFSRQDSSPFGNSNPMDISDDDLPF